MSFDIPIIVACAVALVSWVLYARSPKQSHPFPPGPPRTAVIGNARQVPAHHKEVAFAEWGKKYGPVTYLSAFGRPIIILNSAKACLDLLDKRSAIYSSRPHSHMADFMGYRASMLLAPYGEGFRKARKLLNSALNSRTARTYWPIQEQAVHKYLGRLVKTPEDFREHIKMTASSIILKVAYGYQLQDTEDPVLPLVEKATESFGRSITGGFYIDYLHFLKYIPLRFWVKSTREFVDEGRKLAVRIREDLFSFVTKEMAAGTNVPSFTSTLLEARGSVTGLGTDEERELIKSAAAILYGAGSDTSAATVAAFMLAMTLYPEVQLKAQEELDRVIGPDRLATWEDRASLPYIDAILKETLRFNSATPLGVPHAVIEDDVYEGMFIPAGATVISNIWALMRDDEYKDPLVFNPDRFLGPNPPTDPHMYAFGFGRRSCPGKDIASGTVYLSIANTLKCFNISKAKDANGKDIEPQFGWSTGLVMHPTDYGATIVPRSEKAVELIKAAVDETSD